MKHFLRNLILVLVALLLLLENSCVVGFSLTTFAVLKKGTKHNANNAAAIQLTIAKISRDNPLKYAKIADIDIILSEDTSIKFTFSIIFSI